MTTPGKNSLTLAQKRQLQAEFSTHLQHWLQVRLEDFFQHLDERFFNLAEQAVNDGVQRSFIDAIRELRQSRGELGQAYQQRVMLAAEQFFLDFKSYQQAFLRTEVHIGEEQDSMELINQDVLEEDLAVMRISHHAENRQLSRLKALHGLLSGIVPGKKIKRSEIPVSPAVLGAALQHLLRNWSGDLQPKLIIYEVFGKHCLDGLGDLYADLISVSQKAGLKVEKKPASIRKERAQNASSDSSQRPVNMDESTLFGVVALVRQLQDEQKASLGLPSQRIPSFPEEWPVATPQTIVNVICVLQSEISENLPRNLHQAREVQAELKERLARKLGMTVVEHKMRLQRIDQHIIDVVNMLFDYILDDPVIPSHMKVLLVRLQMPVLRIALQDKTFLTDRSHPVRDTLNNLAAAAARWVDESDQDADSIYGHIEEAVQRILAASEADVALWIEVNEEFENYILNEERGARVAEERLSQVVQGKERLTLARNIVDANLTRLLPQAIPAVVYQIIDEVWRDVMTLILLREGENSSEWKKAIETAENLIDSVVPRIDLAQRQEQMLKIPALLADLRRGFASISFDASRTATLFKELQHCHVTSLRGLQPATMRYEAQQSAEDDDIRQILEDAYIQQAEQLRQGQWVAWTTLTGKEMRGKLSWRSEVTDLMLFVDLRGRRVAEMSSSELADLLRNGRASVLESIDRPIIERALAAIYNALSRQLPGHVLPA